MYKLFRGRTRIIVLAILVIVLGAAVYGFADANTFPDGVSYAGEGEGDISGYEVTDITYLIDDNDPTLFSSVGFTLNQPATDVYAGIGPDSGSLIWTDDIGSCTDGGSGLVWTCSFAGVGDISVNAALVLAVSASQ